MPGKAGDIRTAAADAVERRSPNSRPGIGSRIAPAVALLMLGDSVCVADEDGTAVPEPSVLTLLAAGAAVGGVAKYVRSKRRKK